jgi:hypothetical protein
MKKLIIILLLFIGFKASAQNTVTLPSGTVSYTPAFRYGGSLTDSLKSFWFNVPGGGYNQWYSGTYVNKYFLRKTDFVDSLANKALYFSTNFQGYGSMASPLDLADSVTINQRLRIGISSTPAWNSLYKIVNMAGNVGIRSHYGTHDIMLFNNLYNISAGNTWHYSGAGFGSFLYLDNGGGLEFFSAPSGTSADSISLTVPIFSVTRNGATLTTLPDTTAGYKAVVVDVNGKLQRAPYGGSGGGTTTNALTNDWGINTFSFNGGTAGIKVGADTSSGKLATQYYASVVVGPDEVVSGMSPVTVSGTTATVPAGTYRQNNALYTKSTSTNLTIDAQDATKNRFDLIVGDNTSTLSVVSGAPATTPAEPDIPSGKTLISSIYIPATGGTVTTTGGGTAKGTVTKVSGVNANGFSWSIANSTTTPTITLLLQNATASQSGQLTSTDWNTFNNKQASLGTGSSGNILMWTGGAPTWTNAGLLNLVSNEVPSGSINGTNTTFTLANTPILGSVSLYRNGVLQYAGAGNDYTISGSTITTTTAPGSGSILLATYTISAGSPFTYSYTFSTGLTNTSGTITVNTSQNISTLSNLTTNGLIKTSGGTGALSIATSGVDFQAPITLTTTGTSGAATFVGNTLNIPQYAGTTYSAGIGLTLTTGTFSVNTSQNISTLSNLTSNGLIKTSGGTGAISIATSGTDYQAPITLTTTGTSGAATLVGNTLNIPQYSGGSSGVSSFSAGTTGLTPNLATTGAITLAGTLGVSNGGTGATSVTTSPTASSFAGWDANKNLFANNHIFSGQSIATAGGITTLTVSSPYETIFTGTSNQTVTMPVASTLSQYQSFLITNTSTGTITINSSGGNLIATVPASTEAKFTCILTSGTSAASWTTPSAGTYLPLAGGSMTGQISSSFSTSLSSDNGLGGSSQKRAAIGYNPFGLGVPGAYFNSGSTNAFYSYNKLFFSDGTNQVNLQASTLTATRTISLPDDNGTIALTKNNISWSEVTTGTMQIQPGFAYVATGNAGAQYIFSLPTTCAVGQRIAIAGSGSGGWTLQQQTGQTIIFGATSTTAGTSGHLDSANRYDSVELVCTVANTTFVCISHEGSPTVH